MGLLVSDNFRQFLSDFENAWETETLQDNSEVRKNHLTYAISPNKQTLYVYVWNRQCVGARLEAERCWIDNTKISAILRNILPEYLPYFQNQKNLTSTGMTIEPA